MIRQAMLSDKTEIFEILSDTQSPWSLMGVSEVLENDSDIVLVFAEENIYAVLIMQLVADECEILNFAVSKEHRRQGKGMVLLEKGIELCDSKGAKNFYLEVRRSNEAAIAIYEKAGFEIVGERKKYYQSPLEDAIVFSLKK